MGNRDLFLATAYFGRYSHYFKILIVLLSVAIPLALLYYVYASSFDKTFDGRAYYLFFVWLIVLEFVLDWDRYGSKRSGDSVKHTFAFGLTLTLPTCYGVVSNFFGLNALIVDVVRLYGIIPPWLNWTPLAIEFLVFTVLFAVIILFAYSLKGVKDFSFSIGLLGAVGAYHLMNVLYPHGGFTPFQILVPATATQSADVLNLMGYQARLVSTAGSLMPTLFISNSKAAWWAQIA